MRLRRSAHIIGVVASETVSDTRMATDSVTAFLTAVGEETGFTFDTSSPDLDGTVEKLGPIARIVKATLRDTANPTMLKAGYKSSVVPATAEAVIDCRVLPGRLAAFEAEVDELIGPDVSREWITDLPSYETTFDGDFGGSSTGKVSIIGPGSMSTAVGAATRIPVP